MNDPKPQSPRRLTSLDQFRGYTVAGMLLVNFVGGFQAVPNIVKHHNTYCSYADTIMPQFFLAVGIAFRLTWLSRQEREGRWSANLHALKRGIALILVGAVVYHLDGEFKTWADLSKLGLWGFLTTAFQRNLFQTLVHIGVTMIWVLPVIGARPGFRVGYIVASAVLHHLLSQQFYFEFARTRPCIDGGPLGFLTWTTPILVGSLIWDLLRSGKSVVSTLLPTSIALMAIGYGLSCLGPQGMASPPFSPPADGQQLSVWTMSQRTGSNSYLLFSTGFSVAVFLAFHLLCDRWAYPLEVPIFRTFGQQALAVYILHPMIASLIKPFVPRDAPGWYVTGAFLLHFSLCYVFARHFERHKINLHV